MDYHINNYWTRMVFVITFASQTRNTKLFQFARWFSQEGAITFVWLKVAILPVL